MQKQETRKQPIELQWRCPRCLKEVIGYPAISRRDCKTKICSNCGTEEAMFDFKINQFKEAEKKWMNRIK